MPSTVRVRRTVMALRRMVDECIAFHAITGIITFSSSWPASAATQIAVSQP
jgi:hypothetical protein